MDGSEQKVSLAGAPQSDADAMIEDAMETAEAETDPQARIAELETELAETRDRMLRALAEAENTRRRAAKDREESNKYGGMRLARDVLSVHDNFKRALASIDDSTRDQAKDFIEGVELTQRELLNAFAKHNIVVLHPEIGERFDADIHQAMFEAPVPNVPDGSVIEVMQDGFMLSDRLLRAAMVGVARGGAQMAAKQAAEGDSGDTPDDVAT